MLDPFAAVVSNAYSPSICCKSDVRKRNGVRRHSGVLRGDSARRPEKFAAENGGNKPSCIKMGWSVDHKQCHTSSQGKSKVFFATTVLAAIVTGSTVLGKAR